MSTATIAATATAIAAATTATTVENAKPAEAILASTLISSSSLFNHEDQEMDCDDDEEREGDAMALLWSLLGLRYQSDISYVDGGENDKSKRERETNGNGGIEDGRVSCISGDESSGISEISQTLLRSHLLASSSQTSTATVIDARGTFDVRRLYETLISHMIKTPTTRTASSESQPRHRSNDEETTSIQDKAAEILERVKIMRVFDVEGLFEGIEELKEGFEKEEEKKKKRRRSTDTATTSDNDGQRKGEGEEATAAFKQIFFKSTIADSQAENDGLDEDMLDDVIDNTALTSNHEVEEEIETDEKSPSSSDNNDNYDDDKNNQTHLLIIDNLTQLFGPVIKNNYIQGQALLTLFLRSLRQTSRRHNIKVILLNSTLTYKDDYSHQQQQQDGSRPSAFSSVVSRPSLGKTLDYMVDTHLFVNRLPMTLRDVRILADGEGRGGYGVRDVQWVSAVEVLQDRDGDKAGRVGLFITDKLGGLRCAF